MASTVAILRSHTPYPDKGFDREHPILRAVEGRTGELVPRDAVLRALGRVLDSNVFRQSIRLSQFLRFTVEQTQQGFGGELKEYRIATEVYGRRDDFDSAQDTIVRSEARRLRRKLTDYYEGEGKDDEVVISVHPGSYVPVARWKSPVRHRSAAGSCDPGVSTDEVQVVVTPILSNTGDQPASALAFALSDEILHKLMRVAGIRVVWHSVGEPQQSNAGDASSQITVGGAVRTINGRLRITVRITGPEGLVLWSQRFDAANNNDGQPASLSDLIAGAIVTRMSPRRALPRGYAGSDGYLFYAEALAAEALFETASIASVGEALRMFEELATKVPEYARSHSGVAQCCAAWSQCGAGPWEENQAEGKRACLKALSADPDASQAHSALGCILAQQWKWREAEECFHAALRLGGQHLAHRQFSQFLLAQNRLDEAWKHLQLADETDSFSAWQKLAKARFLYYSGWHQEADKYHLWLAQEESQPLELKALRAFADIQRADRSSAKLLAESIEAEAGRSPVYQALAAEILASCGEAAAARSLTARNGLLEKAAPVSCFRKARLALSLHDRAEALRFLKDSWHRREPELIWLAIDPRFADIRGEKDYRAIREAVFDESRSPHAFD